MQLKYKILAHIIAYTVDMSLAIAAFIYGFGLTVDNWWALIGIGIAGRFLTHTYHSALWHKFNKSE